MSLLHCKKCHHEFESADKDAKCDWCGEDSYILETQTALEKAINWILEKMQKEI